MGRGDEDDENHWRLYSLKPEPEPPPQQHDEIPTVPSSPPSDVACTFSAEERIELGRPPGVDDDSAEDRIELGRPPGREEDNAEERIELGRPPGLDAAACTTGASEELTDDECMERIDFASMTKTGASSPIQRVFGMSSDAYIDSIKATVHQAKVLFDVPYGDAPGDLSYTDPTGVDHFTDSVLPPSDLYPDMMPILDDTASLEVPIVSSSYGQAEALSLVKSTISLELMSEAQQIDIGANICLTGNSAILHNCHQIAPFRIGSAEKGRQMLSTVMGYIPLTTSSGQRVWAPTYYCPEASGTLISPDFICTKGSYFNRFVGEHNIDTNRGCLQFCPRDGSDPLEIPLTRRNRLWYIDYEVLTEDTSPAGIANAANRPKPTSKAAQLASELWLLRMGCPAMSTLQKTVHHSDGVEVDITPHPYHFSDIATDAKPRRSPATKDKIHPATEPGERFHMDFGFMRASSAEYKKVRGKPRIVESYDGFTSYLIVMDAVSRKMWIFLNRSKEPPLEHVGAFLQREGLKDGPLRAIRTDQGGELARSEAFGKLVATHGYTIEPTGSDAPNQNGLAERPNQTLGNMVRSLLYMSGLHPKFWSAALLHAAWLYDRSYHSSIGKTPYEAWTGHRPDLSRIRLFGARVAARLPGKRAAKLDRHMFHGIFLGYTGTDKNVRYYDLDSGRVKTAKHVVFDEAHYSQKERPPGPQLLYDLGLEKEEAAPSSTLPPPVPSAPCPPVPTVALTKTALVKTAALQPLPLRESAIPTSAIDKTSPAPTAVAAAVTPTDDVDEFTPVTMCSDPFGPSFEEVIPIHGVHRSAGIVTDDDSQRGHPRLRRFQQGTPAAKTPRWRSRLKGAHILKIGDHSITKDNDVETAVSYYRTEGKRQVRITFTFDEIRNTMSSQGVPQLYFDQMSAIRAHLKEIKHRHDEEATIEVEGIAHRLESGKPKLTYRRLRQRDDFEEWRQSMFKQLDQYERQNMFGTPTRPPPMAEIFPWVWTFVEKTDGTKKARGVCDGNPKRATVANDRYTYASCVDHTGERIFYASCAIKSFNIYHCDASNAFAEADAPSQRFHMRVDHIFRDWWINHKGREPLPADAVLPVFKAMQGHPESPRLWETLINKILKGIGFIAASHEPCVYRGTINGQEALILRMVDDFAIGCADENTANFIMDAIDAQLEEDLKRYGQLKHFLGMDVEQTQEYIKLSGETYIKKILARHGMLESPQYGLNPAKAIPMQSDSKYIQSLDTAAPPATEPDSKALEVEMGFKYRQVMGELIFALITCRPDISFAVTKLSKFSANPAKVHYVAAKNVLRYLRATADHALYYWRPEPLKDLPLKPRPSQLTNLSDRVACPVKMPANRLHSFMDSDWAGDVSHRRSVTGIAYLLAGALVYWKSRYQPTVAMSSTEAEFYAASDSGKVALYIRSILGDIGLPQDQATPMYEDNNGALLMANAGQPTKRTRHIDIRHFALLDWVEQDLVILERIDTDKNASDVLTKATARILFHRHFDLLMGRMPPSYIEDTGIT